MLVMPNSPITAVFFEIFSSSSARVLQVGDQLGGIPRPVALVKSLLRRKLEVGAWFMLPAVVRADLELAERTQMLALGELCAQPRAHLVF